MAKRTRRDPNQLALLMHPADIKQHVYPADVAVGDDTLRGGYGLGWNKDDEAAMWAVKEQRAKSSGLVTSMQETGYDYSKPVTVSFDDEHDFSSRSQVLVDGHHRVAAAHLANQFVPVKYEDD